MKKYKFSVNKIDELSESDYNFLMQYADRPDGEEITFEISEDTLNQLKFSPDKGIRASALNFEINHSESVLQRGKDRDDLKAINQEVEDEATEYNRSREQMANSMDVWNPEKKGWERPGYDGTEEG